MTGIQRKVAVGLFLVLAVPLRVGATIPAGFLRLLRGEVLVTSRGVGETVTGPLTRPLVLDDVIRTGESVDGRLLLFDGSAAVLEPSSTTRVGTDGVFADGGAGWRLLSGFRVPLTMENLNGVVMAGQGASVPWVAVGEARVQGSPASAIATSGQVPQNSALATGPGAVAKVDYGPRGVAVLRGSTVLRVVPAGFSLESGGALVDLGAREESGLWTGRLVVRATRAFLEVTSVGGRDSVRVLTGRATVSNVAGRAWRRTLGPGAGVVVEATGAVSSEVFKGRREAEAMGRELLARVRKPLLEGFGRSATAQAAAPRPSPSPSSPPAPQASKPSAAKPPLPSFSSSSSSSSPAPRPAPAPGKDLDGVESLDPLRRRIPGASSGDWVATK